MPKGYHQCKFGYGSLNRTKEILSQTQKANIPIDVQWNDIDYMDDRKDFTYDHKKCDNIAQILLEKVTKENTGKQLVLHFFSDNGMLLYKHLTRKLNNHPDGYIIVRAKSLTSSELLLCTC